MNSPALRNACTLIDPGTIAIYLKVPRAHVVLLQTYFELYDGVATVRTMEGEDRVICVLTSQGQQEDCISVLEAIREDVAWEVTTHSDTLRETSGEEDL